jgi:(R,R)-butanediol dehydrogenase/meso-butanediol dehydrogenase/diacetyl reductase/L-iditol 2-dehydrogenase
MRHSGRSPAGGGPADPELNKKIPELISGRGVDRVFEAAGASSPIQAALSIVRKGGSVILIGNISPKIELPFSEGQIWFDKLYNREDNLLKVVLIP